MLTQTMLTLQFWQIWISRFNRYLKLYLSSFPTKDLSGFYCKVNLTNECIPDGLAIGNLQKNRLSNLTTYLVPRTGFEPAHLAALRPEHSASTNPACRQAGSPLEKCSKKFRNSFPTLFLSYFTFLRKYSLIESFQKNNWV